MAKGLNINMIPIEPSKLIGSNVPKLFALLKDAMRDQTSEGVRFMSTYPAKPAGSSYRRTGTLRRSWSAIVKASAKLLEGIIGSNVNVAPYNEEVQGTDQTSLFKTLGWRNVDDLEKKTTREFPGRIDDMVKEAFK